MKKILLNIFFLIGCFIALPVFAAEINFTSENYPSLHNLWEVRLDIDAPAENINTIAGIVSYPVDVLKLREIKTAGSILNFWIEEATSTADGVRFAGITPGGFKGEKGTILTFVFEPVKESAGKLVLKKYEAYLNDGVGSKAKLTVNEYIFKVAEKGKAVSVPDDTIPPQNFQISIGQSSGLYDGKWFAVFATEDKETGIDHYEIQEGGKESILNNWKQVTSPYVLSDQRLRSYIHVRAVDKAGNMTTEILLPTPPKTNYRVFIIWGILLLFTASVFYIWRKLRGKKSLK